MASYNNRLARRLSPRRKLHAQNVLDYLGLWHGARLFLTDHHYSRLRDHYGLGKAAVNRAIDDLHAIERVTVNLIGKLQVVTALASSVEDEQ